MKKRIAMAVSGMMIVSMLAACGGSTAPAASQAAAPAAAPAASAAPAAAAAAAPAAESKAPAAESAAPAAAEAAPAGNTTTTPDGFTFTKTNDCKTLTVYASLPDYELPTYFSAFEADTGISVNYVRLSSGEMLARIESEKENPQGSIMYGGSVDNYQAAIEADLLEQYTPSTIDQIDPQFVDASGYWAPISTGAIGFALNKDWFTKKGLEYPKTWEDLLKPEFKDQISISHPSTAGTGYMFLATLVQKMGEDEAFAYLAKLNENVRQWTKSGSAPASQVGLGEAAIGVTFGQSVIAVQLEGYTNVDLVFPEDGTGCEIVGVAVIKNGPAEENENAKIFVDWCMTARAQSLYVDSQSGRTPVNNSATLTQGLPDLTALNLVDYDFGWAGSNKSRLVERFGAEIDAANNLLT